MNENRVPKKAPAVVIRKKCIANTRKRNISSGSESDESAKPSKSAKKKNNSNLFKFLYLFSLLKSKKLNQRIPKRIIRDVLAMGLINFFNIITTDGLASNRILVPWTDDEVNILRTEFAEHFDPDVKLPGFAKIREVMTRYPVIARRKPVVIKIWISNNRK